LFDNLIKIEVINKIFTELKNPLNIKNHSFYITVSVGIVVYPDHGKKEAKLMRNLNIALAESRNFAGNNYCFYHEDLEQSLEKKFTNNFDFYQIIKQENFYLEYQPRLNIQTNKISTLHSRIKCKTDSEEFKYLSDSEILTLSSEIGLSEFIFNWQLQIICEHYKIWKEHSFTSLPNICLKTCFSSFQSVDFIENILEIIQKSEINFDNLELELININRMTNSGSIRANLARLSQQGIKFCLSDFDLENFVNLADLELAIHTIKISDKITKNLNKNNYSNLLAKSVVDLAKLLSVEVYADNIDNEEILYILSSINCEEIVGKVFSQPLLSKQVINFLNGKQ